jgi:hypothetical protein
MNRTSHLCVCRRVVEQLVERQPLRNVRVARALHLQRERLRRVLEQRLRGRRGVNLAAQLRVGGRGGAFCSEKRIRGGGLLRLQRLRLGVARRRLLDVRLHIGAHCSSRCPQDKPWSESAQHAVSPLINKSVENAFVRVFQTAAYTNFWGAFGLT